VLSSGAVIGTIVNAVSRTAAPTWAFGSTLPAGPVSETIVSVVSAASLESAPTRALGSTLLAGPAIGAIARVVSAVSLAVRLLSGVAIADITTHG
jgi:hypothetical protein